MRREAEESCIAGLCFEIWICSLIVMPERVQGVSDGVLATVARDVRDMRRGRSRGVARRMIVVAGTIYMRGAIYSIDAIQGADA